MTIVKPTEVKHDKALLFIWQGDDADPAPTKAQDRSIRIAKETGSVVAEVGMVHEPAAALHRLARRRACRATTPSPTRA